MTLMQRDSEVGMHAPTWLSAVPRRVIAISRRLFQVFPPKAGDTFNNCRSLPGRAQHTSLSAVGQVTHEEIAQRIGSSRETVTRLLVSKRKRD